MKCTKEQAKLMSASPSKPDDKYKNQETIVYKIYTDAGTYVGITGNNPMAKKIRFTNHFERFCDEGVQITGIQTLHTFSNRFLALEMEYQLRPERNIGLNKNPGGIRGHHWK